MRMNQLTHFIFILILQYIQEPTSHWKTKHYVSRVVLTGIVWMLQMQEYMMVVLHCVSMARWENIRMPSTFCVVPVSFSILRWLLRHYNILIIHSLTLSIIPLSRRYFFGEQNWFRWWGFARCANCGDDDDGGLLREGYFGEGAECDSAVFVWGCGV